MQGTDERGLGPIPISWLTCLAISFTRLSSLPPHLSSPPSSSHFPHLLCFYLPGCVFRLSTSARSRSWCMAVLFFPGKYTQPIVLIHRYILNVLSSSRVGSPAVPKFCKAISDASLTSATRHKGPPSFPSSGLLVALGHCPAYVNGPSTPLMLPPMLRLPIVRYSHPTVTLLSRLSGYLNVLRSVFPLFPRIHTINASHLIIASLAPYPT